MVEVKGEALEYLRWLFAKAPVVVSGETDVTAAGEIHEALQSGTVKLNEEQGASLLNLLVKAPVPLHHTGAVAGLIHQLKSWIKPSSVNSR